MMMISSIMFGNVATFLELVVNFLVASERQKIFLNTSYNMLSNLKNSIKLVNNRIDVIKEVSNRLMSVFHASTGEALICAN